MEAHDATYAHHTHELCIIQHRAPCLPWLQTAIIIDTAGQRSKYYCGKYYLAAIRGAAAVLPGGKRSDGSRQGTCDIPVCDEPDNIPIVAEPHRPRKPDKVTRGPNWSPEITLQPCTVGDSGVLHVPHQSTETGWNRFHFPVRITCALCKKMHIGHYIIV